MHSYQYTSMLVLDDLSTSVVAGRTIRGSKGCKASFPIFSSLAVCLSTPAHDTARTATPCWYTIRICPHEVRLVGYGLAPRFIRTRQHARHPGTATTVRPADERCMRFPLAFSSAMTYYVRGTTMRMANKPRLKGPGKVSAKRGL